MPVIPGSATLLTRDPEVEKARGRYYGKYQGFVAARDDPDRQGRIRAKVPSLFQADGPAGWTGWCKPASGSVLVPAVNDPVWIEFEHGYLQHGIYHRGWVPDSSKAPAAAVGREDPTWVEDVSGEAGGFGIDMSVLIPADEATVFPPEYPYNKVIATEGGVIVEVDDSPKGKRLRVYHPAGTTILVGSDGSVQIRTAGAFNVRPAGDMNVLLGQGATFKVLYPDGAGLALGASGIVMSGPAVNILGRAVRPGAGDV